MIPLNALFGGTLSFPQDQGPAMGAPMGIIAPHSMGGFFGNTMPQQQLPQGPTTNLPHGGFFGNMMQQNAMPQQQMHPEFWGQLMSLLGGGMGGMR